MSRLFENSRKKSSGYDQFSRDVFVQFKPDWITAELLLRATCWTMSSASLCFTGTNWCFSFSHNLKTYNLVLVVPCLLWSLSVYILPADYRPNTLPKILLSFSLGQILKNVFPKLSVLIWESGLQYYTLSDLVAEMQFLDERLAVDLSDLAVELSQLHLIAASADLEPAEEMQLKVYWQ